jgi:nucleoside phosphorylase
MLVSDYESDGYQIEESIDRILENKPRLRKNYKRPDLSSDRLYWSEFVHPAKNGESFVVVCGEEKSHLVIREERTDDMDNPVIYYGLITSLNQLMKDALIRDRLVAEWNVLCFEMEVAGLINYFPCLMIHGICNYADSYKNKEW